ncbi:MAG: type I 3-dehydroquinate dehydratase [Acidobacteriota bacterium]
MGSSTPSDRAVLVATLASRGAVETLRQGAACDADPSADGLADFIEVRGDLVGDLSPADLPGDRFLYTLRSRTEGGRGETVPRERRERLAAALAAGYELVDLEGERDLTPETLEAIPADRRLISWHGRARDLADLKQRFAALAETPARFYKLIPEVKRPVQALWSLQLLASLERRDVLCFSGGPEGLWTRPLAPRLGAPWVFGAASEDAAGAPGQPTIARLRADFGLPALPPVEAIFGVIGNPVTHSLSPRLHNGAYRAFELPYLYLPFQTERFGDFWLEVAESSIPAALGMPLRGLSVTAPFKRSALAVSGVASPLCESLRVANTLTLRDGVWEAESTDPEGVLDPLEESGVALADADAAVVGAGGAGRAAAFALARAGARVVIFNRGEERGRRAGEVLGLPFRPLADLRPENFDILVQATSLGRSADDPLVIDPERLRHGAALVDLVYGAEATPLVRAARERGVIAIDGREVLLFQALAQFRAMIGRELPPALGRDFLGLKVIDLRGEGR